MRAWSYLGGLAIGAIVGWACTADSGATDCPVGSLDCECTQGGGCDLDYSCVEGFCKDVVSPGTGTPDDGNPETGVEPDAGDDSMPNTSDTTMGQPGTTMSVDGTGDGPKLDVGNAEETGPQPCTETGCRQIDLLFAVDGTGSMVGEIQAIAGTQAFTQVVSTLAELNCGDIEYRIGLTNDNDVGFLGMGANGNPWFDSNEMTEMEIANAFNAATSGLGGPVQTPIGCEHVLASAHDLLEGDTTGFLRDDALLVLVLITDVDDHGYYDQMGFGGFCDGFLCTQTPNDIMTMHDSLVAMKGGDPEALAAIVVAGDPDVQQGSNTCGQPATCCGVGLGECAQAHHAPRLWDFASMQVENNGVTLNICDGEAQIPAAIEEALGTNIDLACQEFEPEG
ncbi:MAG: hypothetical protein AAF721_28570 [Myxococcota bacterium]